MQPRVFTLPGPPRLACARQLPAAGPGLAADASEHRAAPPRQAPLTRPLRLPRPLAQLPLAPLPLQACRMGASAVTNGCSSRASGGRGLARRRPRGT
eukprot:7068809-Alexandrium_andersonii.AAC.1